MNWLTLSFCFAATLVVVSSKKCKSSDDCKQGECCVALSFVAVQVLHHGICVRHSRKNLRCSEPDTEMEYYGLKYFMKYCPCQEGLACQSKRNYKRNETDVSKYLLSLRCQVPLSTPAPETTPQEPETTPQEPETTPQEPETTTQEPETTTQEPDDNGDDGTGDEGTGDDGTGDDGTGDNELPDEIGEGPGGEPPRDDDCLDWELPC